MAITDDTAALVAAQLTVAHVSASVGASDLAGPFDAEEGTTRQRILRIYNSYLAEVTKPHAPGWG